MSIYNLPTLNSLLSNKYPSYCHPKGQNGSTQKLKRSRTRDMNVFFNDPILSDAVKPSSGNIHFAPKAHNVPNKSIVISTLDPLFNSKYPRARALNNLLLFLCTTSVNIMRRPILINHWMFNCDNYKLILYINLICIISHTTYFTFSFIYNSVRFEFFISLTTVIHNII